MSKILYLLQKLELLFFLIYVKNLQQELSSEVKFFTDDASSFITVNCVNVLAATLNSDLRAPSGI